MYRSYKDQGLVLIGIHCDDWEKGLAAANANSIEFPIANDDNGKTQEAYEIMGYPTIFVLDKKGVIRHVDPPDLGVAVKQLLGE